MHHVKSEVIPEIGMTVVTEVVVTIVAHVAAVVTVGVEAAIEKIAARGASDVTSTTTAGQVRTVQTETAKAAEIVARGDKPVAMMEAVVDLVRHADAKYF